MNEGTKPDLQLRTLTIQLNQYGEFTGKYTGEISYSNRHGSHSVILDPIISERLLAFIGPAITEAAARVGREMEKALTSAVEHLNNQKAIEAGDLVNAGVAQ